MKLVYKLLGSPLIYRAFTCLVSRSGRANTYLDTYAKPKPGEKVLDIGCGPGDILTVLPDVEYIGFDINPKYIKAAQERFGNRGRFYCRDVGQATIEPEKGTFDLVLATGVLHHLDDDRAGQLVDLAYKALREGGRFVTYDGCYVPQQSRLARAIVSRDRGRFVRSLEAYVALAQRRFPTVVPVVRHDLLRIPYTYLIMQCTK
jgi:SAM-dependent methyltransferase